MDKVFFIPPPPFYTGRKRDFEADLHSCWYARYGTVVLLFRTTVKSDISELWECDCAMIDVLYDLQTPRCTCRVFSLVALQCSSGVPWPWGGVQCAQCAQRVHTVYKV